MNEQAYQEMRTKEPMKQNIVAPPICGMEKRESEIEIGLKELDYAIQHYDSLVTMAYRKLATILKCSDVLQTPTQTCYANTPLGQNIYELRNKLLTLNESFANLLDVCDLQEK